MVQSCELFQSQVPLPVCSDIVGEAAEGIPSCSSIADSTSIQVSYHCLQGIATSLRMKIFLRLSSQAGPDCVEIYLQP